MLTDIFADTPFRSHIAVWAKRDGQKIVATFSALTLEFVSAETCCTFESAEWHAGFVARPVSLTVEELAELQSHVNGADEEYQRALDEDYE